MADTLCPVWQSWRKDKAGYCERFRLYAQNTSNQGWPWAKNQTAAGSYPRLV